LSPQENATVVRRFAQEVITQGDIGSAVRFAWEDVIEQVPLPGQGPGLEGLKDILRAMRTGFPDLNFAIQEQIAEGDKVASRFEWTGTHRGEFLGVLRFSPMPSPARLPFLALLLASLVSAAQFDITTFGAKGDGKTQNRDAIDKAIDAAASAGGGTVEFPAGTWVTGSIRLRSNITLHLERGAVIEASSEATAYDAPEPNQWDKFQDFGHSHFHNALIWGDGVENVAITGGGRISGAALVRERGATGDKAVALRLARNVTLRDFSILNGGHFGILATGVDNLVIDNLKIDTNRDGIDIDSCRNVRISNSSVNSPNDDAITLKGSHALGEARVSENITITNSMVSGFEIGSLLDGTYKRTVKAAPDRDGPTGRIKIGTESEGDFRNIAISNIVFDTSRGLAFESVDGSHIEDVTVSNITMRNVSNAPLFIRLGSRMRAPEGTAIGAIRRISISNVTAFDADPR
jgi:polygalacturonase/predicted ester cyclase